jgi:hypothetical protein
MPKLFEKALSIVCLAGASLLLLNAPVSAQASDVVEIVSPKGGEVIHIGDTIKIRWILHGTQIPIGVVPLLSPNGGKSSLWLVRQFIKTGDTTYYADSVATFVWIVPDSIRSTDPGTPNVSIVSEECLININLPYNSELGDYFTGFFTIKPSVSKINSAKIPLAATRRTRALPGEKPGMFTLSGRQVHVRAGSKDESRIDHIDKTNLKGRSHE